MKKMELYERISSMSVDYIKCVSKYSEEAGIEVLNKCYADVPDSENTSYTGYVPLIAWMRHAGKSDKHSYMIYQCYNWNKTKVFYSFNESLENEIKSSNITPTMFVPAILLNQCPFSSFFVQTRGGFIHKEIDAQIGNKIGEGWNGVGFFCTISDFRKYDHDKKRLVKTGDKVIDIACCSGRDGDENLISAVVSMRVPSSNQELTIKDVVIYAFDYNVMYSEEKAKYCREYDDKILLTALQYILHLCSENSTILPRPLQEKKVKSWASKKKKSAASVKVYDVSIRDFPNKLRSHSSSGNKNTGITKAPHVRRAHWAYRWVGKGEERHLALRWIHEAYIHPELENTGVIVNVKDLELNRR